MNWFASKMLGSRRLKFQKISVKHFKNTAGALSGVYFGWLRTDELIQEELEVFPDHLQANGLCEGF